MEFSMDLTMANSTVAFESESKDCGNPNCPQHGKSKTVGTTKKKLNSSDCGKQNCPKHGDRAVKSNAEGQAAFANGLQRSAQKNTVKIDDRGATYIKPSSTNTMKVFTTNKNTTFLGEPTTTPSTTPSKFDASPGETYNQMKMEHAQQEVAMLQAITRQQQNDLLEVKKQLEDEKRYRVQERKVRHILREDLERQVKSYYELQEKLADSEGTVMQLKKRLQAAEMTTQKLRRRASENAQNASKWRAKVLAVQAAQKTLQQLQRQLGVSLEDGDRTEARSESLDILNTTILEFEPMTPVRQTNT